MKQTIRIAVRKFAPFESAMQKLWDNYCAESGCQLDAELVAMDLDELHKAVITDDGLQNGSWDIAHVVTDWLLEAWTAGALTDLQPYIRQSPPLNFPEGWSPSLLGMQQFDGAVAGLPFHDGPECLIYRKDLFESLSEQQNFEQQFGKPLAVPQTWDDFKQIAQFFYRPDDNLYGSVFAGYPDGHNAVFDFCLQLWTRGGELTDGKGQVKINTAAAREGLTYYRDVLRDNRVVHPQTMSYESVASGMAFARGEAAMMVNWFGFASMCEVIDESVVKGKVDIIDLPAAPGGKPASLNVYWLYTIGSGSRHQQTAYDFLRYATSPKNDKLLTLEGGIGCRLSTWTDNDINQTIPYYHKLEHLHQSARSLPMLANWSQIAHSIDRLVQAAIYTDTPIDELLAQAQQQIDLLN